LCPREIGKKIGKKIRREIHEFGVDLPLNKSCVCFTANPRDLHRSGAGLLSNKCVVVSDGNKFNNLKLTFEKSK
jgi:hypothetical protein